LVIKLKRRLDYKDGSQSDGALEVLKKRYAKGEITKDQFEEIKKDLLA